MIPMSGARKEYVEHPRYGTAPRLTGLDADMDSMEVHLHDRLCAFTKPLLEAFRRGGWGVPQPRDDGPRLIPGTAIAADLTRQSAATVPVTHYYDEERRCLDCRRWFLFFAEEQRFWYEELRFPIEADCVRCHPCRRIGQEMQRTRQEYDHLMTLAEPTPDEMARMAFARILLVEAGRFHARQLEHVRAFLRCHPDHEQSAALRSRMEQSV